MIIARTASKLMFATNATIIFILLNLELVNKDQEIYNVLCIAVIAVIRVNVNSAIMDSSFNQEDFVLQELIHQNGVKLDFIKICVNYVNKIILLESLIYV